MENRWRRRERALRRVKTDTVSFMTMPARLYIAEDVWRRSAPCRASSNRTMKKIWKHTRDSKLRWILIVLGFSLGIQYDPAFWTLAGLGAMIILGDTAEKFYRGIKGAKMSDEGESSKGHGRA